MSLGKSEQDYSNPDDHVVEPDFSFFRGRDEWSVEKELDDYRQEYGDERLMEKIETFLTERGLY